MSLYVDKSGQIPLAGLDICTEKMWYRSHHCMQNMKLTTAQTNPNPIQRMQMKRCTKSLELLLTFNSWPCRALYAFEQRRTKLSMPTKLYVNVFLISWQEQLSGNSCSNSVLKWCYCYIIDAFVCDILIAGGANRVFWICNAKHKAHSETK